jgi:AcrR family transcriptional regulator
MGIFMKRKSAEEKRAHIRHSAYLCFRTGGYHQTSIDDICTSANISKGSFYWHYGAKLDVYIDILENWAREVIDELLIRFESAAKNPNRIEFLSVAFEQEFHRARAIVPLWVEFSLLARTDQEIRLSIGKFYRRARAAIAEILRETTADHLSESEVIAASGIILGAYMGIVLQEYADGRVDASAWAKDFVGILRFVFGGGIRSGSIASNLIETEVVNANVEFPSSVTEEQKDIIQAVFHDARLVNSNVMARWIKGWSACGFYTNRLICFVKIRESVMTLKVHKSMLDKLSDLPEGLLDSSYSIELDGSELSNEIKTLLLALF